MIDLSPQCATASDESERITVIISSDEFESAQRTE